MRFLFAISTRFRSVADGTRVSLGQGDFESQRVVTSSRGATREHGFNPRARLASLVAVAPPLATPLARLTPILFQFFHVLFEFTLGILDFGPHSLLKLDQ